MIVRAGFHRSLLSEPPWHTYSPSSQLLCKEDYIPLLCFVKMGILSEMTHGCGLVFSANKDAYCKFSIKCYDQIGYVKILAHFGW